MSGSPQPEITIYGWPPATLSSGHHHLIAGRHESLTHFRHRAHPSLETCFRYSQELMSFEQRLEKPIPSFGFFSLWSRQVLGCLLTMRQKIPPSDFR